MSVVLGGNFSIEESYQPKISKKVAIVISVSLITIGLVNAGLSLWISSSTYNIANTSDSNLEIADNKDENAEAITEPETNPSSNDSTSSSESEASLLQSDPTPKDTLPVSPSSGEDTDSIKECSISANKNTLHSYSESFSLSWEMPTDFEVMGPLYKNGGMKNWSDSLVKDNNSYNVEDSIKLVPKVSTTYCMKYYDDSNVIHNNDCCVDVEVIAK